MRPVLLVIALVLLTVALAIAASFGYRAARERDFQAQARQGAEARALRAEQMSLATQATYDELVAARDAALQSSEVLRKRVRQLQDAVESARVTSVATTETVEPVESQVDVSLGDRLKLTVTQLTFETKEHNVVLVGEAQVWLVDPPPPRLVATGELRGELVLETPPSPVKRGWTTTALLTAGLLGVVAGGTMALFTLR